MSVPIAHAALHTHPEPPASATAGAGLQTPRRTHPEPPASATAGAGLQTPRRAEYLQSAAAVCIFAGDRVRLGDEVAGPDRPMPQRKSTLFLHGTKLCRKMFGTSLTLPKKLVLLKNIFGVEGVMSGEGAGGGQVWSQRQQALRQADTIQNKSLDSIGLAQLIHKDNTQVAASATSGLQACWPPSGPTSMPPPRGPLPVARACATPAQIFVSECPGACRGGRRWRRFPSHFIWKGALCGIREPAHG